MTDHHDLIQQLSQQLPPVRRPLPLAWRIISWLGLALPCGALMSTLVSRSLTDWSQPGAAWGILQLLLCLTAGIFAIAQAFNGSIAGRRRLSWLWLLPLLVAWLAALLAGQAASLILHDTHDAADSSSCYRFMLTVSLPMVVITLAYLRRTRSLTPLRSLCAAGVGVACMAMVLLALCHPVHQHPQDLLMHLAAFVTILLLTVVCGRPLVRLPQRQRSVP